MLGSDFHCAFFFPASNYLFVRLIHGSAPPQLAFVLKSSNSVLVSVFCLLGSHRSSVAKSVVLEIDHLFLFIFNF